MLLPADFDNKNYERNSDLSVRKVPWWKRWLKK